MGCNASKSGIRQDMEGSNYIYDKPLHDGAENHNINNNNNNNLGRKSISSSPLPMKVNNDDFPTEIRSGGESRVNPVHDNLMEVEGKRENDIVDAKRKKGRGSSLGGAPSFKDYYVSSSDDFTDAANMIHGSDDEDEDEEKERIEKTTENNVVEVEKEADALAGEASLLPRKLSANKDDDAIVGDACLLPRKLPEDKANDDIMGEACLLPRKATTNKSKVKGRGYFKGIVTGVRLKNLLHASSWTPHKSKSIGRDSSNKSS